MNTLLRALGLFLVCGGLALARMNVNTATPAELEALPEVGPVKAKAIADYRKKNGPFKALEDLEKVPGVGPATIKALKNEVSFSGASTPVALDKKKSPAVPDAAPKPPGNKAPVVNPATPAVVGANKAKDKPLDALDRQKGKGNDQPAAGKTNDPPSAKIKAKGGEPIRPQ